jgi:hypothetical protein
MSIVGVRVSAHDLDLEGADASAGTPPPSGLQRVNASGSRQAPESSPAFITSHCTIRTVSQSGDATDQAATQEHRDSKNDQLHT